jgi:hypothetical protein
MWLACSWRAFEVDDDRHEISTKKLYELFMNDSISEPVESFPAAEVMISPLGR